MDQNFYRQPAKIYSETGSTQNDFFLKNEPASFRKQKRENTNTVHKFLCARKSYLPPVQVQEHHPKDPSKENQVS